MPERGATPNVPVLQRRILRAVGALTSPLLPDDYLELINPLIEGGPIFHIISGNLGYQVEHHLYPDMPSTRYGEIAPRVREICERYDLPYNTGPLWKQWGMVHRTIARLAFPGGKPRPKPGPYRGDKVINPGEREERVAAA